MLVVSQSRIPSATPAAPRVAITIAPAAWIDARSMAARARAAPAPISLRCFGGTTIPARAVVSPMARPSKVAVSPKPAAVRRCSSPSAPRSAGSTPANSKEITPSANAAAASLRGMSGPIASWTVAWRCSLMPSLCRAAGALSCLTSRRVSAGRRPRPARARRHRRGCRSTDSPERATDSPSPRRRNRLRGCARRRRAAGPPSPIRMPSPPAAR